MAKKGICIVTKNKAFAYKFKLTLEEKTNVRWADGSLPTQVTFGYEIFCFEPNPHNRFNVLTGATYNQLEEDKSENYGFFKDLMTGEYDIYVL